MRTRNDSRAFSYIIVCDVVGTSQKYARDFAVLRRSRGKSENLVGNNSLSVALSLPVQLPLFPQTFDSFVAGTKGF